MMKSNATLTLGYELEDWKNLGIKKEISVDISPKTNSHILLCGMSGSGKSYTEFEILCKLILAEPDGEYFFADYKSDDMFECLRGTPRYRSFKQTIELLNIVYDRMYARMSGDDETRHPITLIWDEYVANILAIMSEDKSNATKIMNKVGEILLLGRSVFVRICTCCQRPDMAVYSFGSRINYGVIIVLGNGKSIHEMLLPDHLDEVKKKEFNRGEGVVLLQGFDLHFIKIGQVNDMERMKRICVEALSRPIDDGEA